MTEAPTVDHERSRFDAKYRIDNTLASVTRIPCSPQRYPNGVVVTIEPAGAQHASRRRGARPRTGHGAGAPRDGWDRPLDGGSGGAS